MSQLIPGKVVDGVGPVKAPFIKVTTFDRKTMAASNGAANGEFGRVEGGTFMSVITGGADAGKVRPAFKQAATNSGAASAGPINVPDTSNAKVGDALWINGADSGETIASLVADTSVTASGNVTWNSGEIISAQGTGVALGINEYDVTSYQPAVDGTGAVVHTDKGVNLVQVGVVVESALTGTSTSLKADLVQIIYR